MTTKNTFGKKLLSLILSLLMVVTMLPTFAITASAYTDLSPNLLNEFFKDSSIWKDSATASGGVSWQTGSHHTYNSTDRLTYFDGTTYLKMADDSAAKMSNINSASGMTVSFRYKNANDRHRHLLSLGSSVYSGSSNANNSFYISAADSWMAPNCGLFIGYVDDSGNQRLNCYPDGFTFAANTVYDVTISISSSKIDYYINGKHYDAVGYNNNETYNSTYLTAALNAINGFRQNYIGCSRWADGNINGAIGDMRIYSKAVTEEEYYDLALKDYENYMDGTVYTNMAAAYEAYVDLNEAVDAYRYGGTTGQANAQREAACIALKTAVNNMTVFSATTYTANGTVKWKTSSEFTEYGNYKLGIAYNNILYASDVGYYRYSPNRFHGVGLRLQYSATTVMLFDGVNDAKMPVGAICQENVTGNRQINQIYPSNKDGGDHGIMILKEAWHTAYSWDNENVCCWDQEWDGSNRHPGHNASTNIQSNNLDKWRGFANVMYYNGGDFNSYGREITDLYWFGKENSNNTTTVDATGDRIKIVNYKYYASQIANAISNNLGDFSSGNYREGGALALFNAVDIATSLDPNSSAYFNNGTTDAYSKIVADMATNVSNISGATVKTDDNANNYIALRNAIDYEGIPTGLADNTDITTANKTLTPRQLIANSGKVDTDNDGTVDTVLTGYEDFVREYNAAVAVMAALGDPDNNTDKQSAYTDSTAGAKATALSDAFNGLNLVSLTTPTITINNGSGGAYIGKTNGVTIASNDGKTVQYSVRTSDDGGSTWTAWSTYATYSAELKPFSSLADNADKNNWAEFKTRSTDGNNHFSSESAATQVKFLSAPTLTSSSGDDELTASGTVTLAATSDASGTLQYSYDNSTWNTYSTAIAPFTDNTSVSTITVYARENKGTSYSPVTSATYNKSVLAPSFSVADGTYLDASHSVTITNNAGNTESGSVTIEYHYDTASYSAYNSALTPFTGTSESAGAASKTIYARATRNGKTAESSITVHYLSRPAVTVGGSDSVLTASDVITVTNTSGATDGLKYSIDGSDNGTTIADGGTFAPFALNTTATKLTIKVWQEKDGSTSPVYTTTVYKKPTLPNITGGEYLDKTHGVTITANDGTDDTASTIEYYCEYMGVGAWVNYSDTLVPFSGLSDSAATATATVYYRAKRTIDGKTAYSDYATYTVKYLSRPAIKNAAGTADITAKQELLHSDTVTLASTCSLATGLEYSYDGTNWNSYTTAIAPFVDNPTRLDVTIYARQKSGDSTSAVYSVKVVKNDTFYIYSYTSGRTPQYSAREFNNTSKLYVSTVALDNDTIVPYSASNQTIYYMVTVDGVADAALYEYDATNGIDVSAGAITGYQPDLSSASIVKIVAYLCEDNGGGNVTVRDYATQTFFNSVNYSDEVMHESFNNASVSGTTLTLSDGSTATLTGGADTASVLDGAGWIDGNGNSPDWRNNVLKINANSTAPGNSVQLNTNPLSVAKNAAAANNYGVTISFWRYLEKNGTCTDLASSSDPTGYPWRNAIAFDDGSLNSQGYYLVEVNGVNSICKTQGNTYYDYVQENQDPTQHAAGNQRGNWVNVVVTIDPANGVTLYTNGEPHEMKSNYPKKGGDFASMTDAQVAQEIISLITSGNMYFNYGDAIEGNDFDMYLDDIRIYTGVKTQLDINNMYIADDADVNTDLTSTSHDPTNVTVYTLARAVTTDSNGTKSAGSKVGQEFIDYYGLDVNDSNDISAVDDYSFGTGMTVYHRNKSTGKWEVVGDDAGRCGYQNQKLFGAEYHTGIATALEAATGSGSAEGAGHLVWAPHVMYNLTTDKWVYYGSTSSWSVQKSAIFMCQNDTNDDITGPYTYKEIIYKSTAHPNAIDACVYYQYSETSSGSGVYKPVVDKLYMVFGSWGGSNAIASKSLNANGTTKAVDGYDGGIIATGMTESASSDGTSAEGAYIVFNNGYYYLYVSYGQNTGSYAERVFRSTLPNSGFVDIGNTLSVNTEDLMKGNQIISPFDMSNYNYTFVSTGHNSVVSTVNNNGEKIYLHSTHARPLANETHKWLALPDGALATRQSAVTGNVNLLNQLAYTSNGWPVLMPYQYDGSDTVTEEVTAEELEGIYAADDLQKNVSYSFTKEYTYTIIADDEDETKTSAFEYGTDSAGATFKAYIKLSTGDDGTRYADYYASKDAYNNGETPEYFGVVGKHGDEICISMVCTDKEHTWTYRIGDVPKSEDVESFGDSVSMDGVIYTHKANDNYAKYGYEISDDFEYGQNDLHLGERYTTITTTYPAKIDLSNPTAVYCLSDEALCKTGEYSGGSFSVVALNDNKWYDAAGKKYSDAEAYALVDGGSFAATDLHRLYGLTGYVSDYYFNESTGEYADTGVQLIVSYSDFTTGTNYSEFEFCYVMANPAMAHTILGIRNTYSGATTAHPDQRAGHMLYNRFIGSYGSSSNIISSYVANSKTTVGGSNTSEAHNVGTFNYLSNFGSSESIAYDYSSPSKVGNAFTAYNSKVGQTAGSFGVIEHEDNPNDKNYDSRTVSSNVVDTDYYVDYSDEQNSLITRDNNDTPTGYKFTMRTNNIYWSDVRVARWGATSYFLNRTGLNYDASYDSTRDSMSTTTNKDGNNTYGNSGTDSTSSTDASNISGIGKYSTNTNREDLNGCADPNSDFKNTGVANKYTLGLCYPSSDIGPGRLVMSGYLSDPTAYLESHNLASNVQPTDDAFKSATDYATDTLDRGFDYIDAGLASTNSWKMHIDFTGKGSIAKSTDTTSAETYANFIVEQGINVKSWFTSAYAWTYRYVMPEETYAYYNIGVHTCDKGAARAFVDNYLRKKLATTDNGDGTVTVKVDQNTGAPIYLDASGNETTNVDEAATITTQEFTLASYQDYIDAVAELSWFVENPTNTTFADYKNSGSTASTEYTTAYTNDGNPIYITSTSGKDIFKDGTTNTDEVQAMLIKNVIKAYENLFAKVDYTAAEEVYGSIELLDGGIETTTVKDVDEIKVYSDKDAGTVAFDLSKAYYTDDSWEAFVQLVVDVASAFNYDSAKDTGKDSWRYVDLSGSEYKNLVTILKRVSDTLVPVVDVTALTDTRTAKYGKDSAGDATGTVTGGIFTDTAKTVDNKSFAAGEQVYTLASWNTLNAKCDEANTYLDSNNANYALNQNATVAGEDIINGAENEQDFNYTQGQYAVTGVTKYTFDDVDFYARTVSNSVLSAEQTAVNTENTQLGAMALVVVDDPTCFATYDNAYTVVDSLDMDKYTAAGRTIIANAKSDTDSVVYGTFNAAQASAYNAATGASVTAGTKLRLTTDGLTDPQSAALMTAINTVNNTKENNEYKYIKYFKVTFTQQYAGADLGIGSTEQKIMYGESVTVSADSDANLVNWSISIYDGEYADDFSAEPRASQKVSRVIGNSLTRIANNNMAIVAEVEQDSAPEGKTQYNVLDCYGNLKLVVYGTSYSISGATLTIDGNEIGIGDVPFYNLTGWDESTVGGVKTFKPVYSAKESYKITVIGGTTGYAEYDTKYTVSTDVSGFAAWATKVDGKYQIASYSPSYTFFVATNETFVPIVSDGEGGYETTDGDAITAAKLDGEITETGSIDANTFVNNKIANRAPFVSVQRADMANKNDAEKYTKARVFVRITEGCNETTSLTSYGVLYRSGSTDADKAAMVINYAADSKTYRRAVTNKLTSGQFTYTLNSANGFKQDVTFRAYVNYNFTYTAGGTDATINALDYSGISVAEL